MNSREDWTFLYTNEALDRFACWQPSESERCIDYVDTFLNLLTEEQRSDELAKLAKKAGFDQLSGVEFFRLPCDAGADVTTVAVRRDKKAIIVL